VVERSTLISRLRLGISMEWYHISHPTFYFTTYTISSWVHVKYFVEFFFFRSFSDGYEGDVYRECDANTGRWKLPVYNCTNQELTKVSDAV